VAPPELEPPLPPEPEPLPPEPWPPEPLLLPPEPLPPEPLATSGGGGAHAPAAMPKKTERIVACATRFDIGAPGVGDGY